MIRITPVYLAVILLSSVLSLSGQDDINITYPNVGTLYSSDGNGMQVNWNYQSQSNDMQSLSWAYKLDEDFYGTGTSATQVDGNDSVEGSSWLSSISADGQTHTLYVALLDGSGNRLADEQYSFTYNTGSKYKSQSTLMVNQESWNTGIPGASSGTWYQSFKANFDSKLHKFAFVTNGVFNATATVTIMEGVGTDGTILHTGTWTGIGTNTNDYNEYTPDEDVMLTLDQNYTIQLQNQTSGGFIGHSSNQYDDGIFYYSGYSGEYGDLKMKIWAYEENPIPDSISIHYPDVSILYSSDGNGMQVNWNYQSQSNDMQSLSWAYKLDEDFYGTGTSATQVDGNDSVDGSSWLSGLTADGGSHTLYVALLDQGSNVLATDNHGFTYQSGSSGTQSGGGGTQSPGGGYQTPSSGYQSPDGISIHYPDVSILYSSDYNGMQVNWNYQSQSNDMQSLSWAYKLDEDFYGTGTSATQVDGNDSVDGSSWLSGLTADGGSHTLYVALLDQGSNVLATDNHGFTYQSGSSGTQSGGGGTHSPGGGYQTPSSGYQSPDGISIHYPDVSILYSSDYNGMQVNWNYQSHSNDMQSLSWAYKLDEDFYGTGTSATQVDGNDSVDGSSWLSGLTADGGSHTLYVALLDQGSNVLATDNHGFTYQSGSSGTQSGGGGTQSPGGGYQTPSSGYQSPDGISIHYPDVSILYSSDYNGMQVNWNYQSQSNDMQSLSWAYKLDEDFYGTGTSATQVDGNDSVDGSSWLSGLTADGGSHTLYVALLDQGSNVLATDNHGFTYQSGSSGTQSGSGGTQSPGGGYQTPSSGYQSPDGISIHYPDVSNLYSSDYNGMQVNWNYQSQSNDMQSLSWAYKLDEDFYGTSTSATQVDGNDSVDGSTWLSSISADGQTHTLYVALLDGSGNPLTGDHHSFTYNAGSDPYSSGGSGYQSDDGSMQSGDGGYQSPTSTYNGPTEWIFTNANANGSYGPTQSQIDSNYSGTSLDGKVNINTQGIQEWSIPVSGTFKIEVLGAAGGSYFHNTTGGSGGRGAKMIGEFNLTKDEQLKILIGQLGESIGSSSVNTTNQYGGAGGGGGTFVVGSSNILLAAGGGSGAGGGTDSNPGLDGNISTDGGAGLGRSNANGAIGGTNGNAGSKETTNAQQHDPGAGYLQSSTNNISYGAASAGAKSFADGGAGQDEVSQNAYGSGGFGGASAGNERKGGAGGGYSGGGSVSTSGSASSFGVSGGGGSYNSGTNQNNQAGANAGHGKVVITLISSNNNTPISGDSISIHYPDVSILYSSDYNGMQINWNYQSQSNDMQSLSWAYKLDEDFYGTSTSATQVDGNDSVDGSTWLSSISADGQTHTLYVALLDGSGNPLAGDQHSFTYNSGSDPNSSGGSGYQSGDGGTQSGDGGYQSGDSGYQSSTGDSISIHYPDVSILYSSGYNGMQVNWNYQSQSNDMQSLSWAYKLDEDFYGTSTSATQVDGNDSVDGSTWLSSISADGQSHTLYVALLDGSGNALADDQHSFTYNSGSDPNSSGGSGYQSGDGGTQSGGGGYQSGDSGYQSSTGDSISIHYPDVSILYSSGYNGMQVNWNYQSQSNDMQSLRWAYKLDEDFYGTSTSATQVDGNASVDGSTWLSSISADGQTHTLYVALLDGSGNPLAGDQHSFTYNSGSDPNSSGGSGYQSGDGGTQSGDGGYQSPGDGYQSDTSGYNSINITYPTIYNVSDWNSLEIEWTYASGVANQSSPSFGYTIDENITSQGVYINEFNTSNIYGSEWLGGLSDGEHTVFVALLDPTNGSILATDSHLFSLTSSTEPEVPGTSNDDITIINPGSGAVIERNASLSVDLSYASEVSSSESPRWAYKINEDFYSSQTSAIEVNSTSVQGWLDDLEDGEHTVYVALLMTYGGDYILAEDNVTFELVGDEDGVPPYFNFTDTDLSQFTGRTDLAEGNYTILKDHNSSESSYFKIAPVYRDEKGYVLVEIESAVSSSIDFASLEVYLDGYNIEPLGFVDFMPFDFHPIDRIDLNSTSVLGSQINGYSSLFYQEYTPREWQSLDEFNGSDINTNTWDVAYFAGGISPSVSGGKAVLSGNASTGNDSSYVPEILGIGEVPTDEGNSALFLNDEDVLGVELEVTIPSQGNSQEFGFFIDAFDNQQDHLEIIELAWRLNGVSWSWEEPSDDFGQSTYQSLDAELNKTYKVRVTHINQNTRVWIDGELISNIKDNNFTARSWLIGAFNDNGESFEASIDNVRVLKALPAQDSPDHYWALSIENSDSNKSDLVVDMAGFVYEGHFEDYWYHWFGLSTYEPNVDEEIQNPDWSEHHFSLSNGTVGDVYSTFPQIGQDHSLFSQHEFNMTENNELNITIGNVQLRLPELFGDLFYSVEEFGETNQQLPISVTNDGNIIVNQSIDYESQPQLSFYLTIGDEFDRNITELVTILIEDVFEDLDGDGYEDHLDSDIDGDTYENEYEISNGFDPRNADSRPQLALVYTLSPNRNSSGTHLLKGSLLTDGGVSLTEIGFEINGDGYSLNEKIPVNTDVSVGGEFTHVLSDLTPGETYTYRAYATNVAGYNTGAPRNFTVEKSQDWWYGAEELDAGWKSNWIGIFLPQPNGWAYHTELGWAFVSPDGSGGLWLWDEGNGWHWTREGIWPFLWSNNTADWLYLMKSGNRVFLYDYSTQSFITDF